jgi:hypothetical protein
MRKIPKSVRAQSASFIVPVFSSVVLQSPYEIPINTALMLFPVFYIPINCRYRNTQLFFEKKLEDIVILYSNIAT